MKNTKPLTSSEIFHRLKKKYPPDEYALLAEVGDGTGAARRRTVDALAMSLWPSRGLEVHGFEFKSNRSDWLREKENPAKADAIQKYCDRWWLVVGSKEIVMEDEVPKTWGVIVPHGKGLRVQWQPRQHLKPEQLSRSFLAAIFRRFAAPPEDSREQRLTDLSARYEAGYTEAKRFYSNRESVLAGRVKRFEESSGLTVAFWDGEKVGEAVRFILKGDFAASLNALNKLRDESEKIFKSTSKAIAEFEALEKK